MVSTGVRPKFLIKKSVFNELFDLFLNLYLSRWLVRAASHLTLFLLGGGGGGWNPPPSGFSSITQKLKKIFSSNLATFFIDKWVIICTIKLEHRPFHVAIVMAQIKGFKMTFLKKHYFSILTSEMEN